MWGKKKKDKKAQKSASRGSLMGGPREEEFGTFSSSLSGKTRADSAFSPPTSRNDFNDFNAQRRFTAHSRFQDQEEDDDDDDDDEGFVISGISTQDQEDEEVIIISSTNESTTPSSAQFTKEMNNGVLVLTATATQDIYAQEEDEESADEFVICGFTNEQPEVPTGERRGTFEDDLWSFLKNVAPGTKPKGDEEVEEEGEDEIEEEEVEEEEEDDEEEGFVIYGVEELEEEEEEEFDICGIEEKEESDEEEFEIVITSIQTDKILQEQQQQHHQQQQQRKQQQHQRQQAAARGRGRGRGGRGGSVGRGEEKKRKEGFLKGKQSKLRTKSKANLVQEEEIENTDPEVRYAMEQGTKVIKAITLPRLIDQLALEGGVRETFLITYRAFMTPEVLLDMLMARYQDENEEEDPGISMKKKVRLAGVIKAWLERYFCDFEEEIVANKLLSFLDIMEKSMSAVAAQLKKTYQKSVDNISSSPPASSPLSSSIPLEGNEVVQAEKLEAGGWMKMSERDIAEQMTIIESELYIKTLPKEYLAWNKKEKETLSPNICRMIQQFNRVSNWVRSLIVAPPRLKDRVELLEKFVRIMGHLFEMNNFNGLMEILSALNNGAVRRMKKTWEAISPECKENLKKIEKLLSHEYSYGGYRKHLHEIKPPCVPYLGVYLTDLTFVLDGNSDKVKGEAGEMINFFKFRKVAGIIFEVQQYQTTYDFERCPDLQNYFQTLKSTSEEACYRCSSRAEPKNVEKTVGDLIRTETELKYKLENLKNTHNTLQIHLNSLLPPPPPPPSSLSLPPPKSSSLSPSPSPPLLPPGFPRASVTPPPKPKKPSKPSKPIPLPANISSTPLPPPLSPNVSPSASPLLATTSSPSPSLISSPSPPPSSSSQPPLKRLPLKQNSHQTLPFSSSPSSSPPLPSPKRLSKKTSLRALPLSSSSSFSSLSSPNLKRKSLWKGKTKGGEGEK